MDKQVLESILASDTQGLLRTWRIYNLETKEIREPFVFDTVDKAIAFCDGMNKVYNKRIYGIISV